MNYRIKPLNLRWPRFCGALVLMSIPILWSTRGELAASHLSGGSLCVVVFYLSMLFFFAFRWHMLRKTAVAAGQPLESVILTDPLRQLLGPALPFCIWFIVTLAGAIAIGFHWGASP